MRYRKLTEDGDMSFGGGQLDFYRDVPEAVGQAVQTRLLLWSGEWFLDVEEGTPYMQAILGKHSKTTADVNIQERINNTQGLVQINNYQSEIDPVNRRMAVSCDVDTIYGPTQIEIDNYANY